MGRETKIVFRVFNGRLNFDIYIGKIFVKSIGISKSISCGLVEDWLLSLTVNGTILGDSLKEINVFHALVKFPCTFQIIKVVLEVYCKVRFFTVSQ